MIGAADRRDAGDPPAGADDDLAVDELARSRFGEPTSSLPSGVTVAALMANPDSRIARAASGDDLVARRAAVLQREVEALELDADDLRRQQAEALLQQLLARSRRPRAA